MAKVKRNVKRKYDNIDDLITKIDNYFNDCDLNSVPYTIPGLALYLDFPSTEALWNFEHRDRLAGCGDAIKKAKLRVENQLLNKAITSNAAGSMFTLKCAFKYREKDDNTSKQAVSIEIKLPKEMDKYAK